MQSPLVADTPKINANAFLHRCETTPHNHWASENHSKCYDNCEDISQTVKWISTLLPHKGGKQKITPPWLASEKKRIPLWLRDASILFPVLQAHPLPMWMHSSVALKQRNINFRLVGSLRKCNETEKTIQAPNEYRQCCPKMMEKQISPQWLSNWKWTCPLLAR